MKRLVGVIAVLIAVLVVGVTIAAAFRATSPEQQVANAQAPPVGATAARVERRALRSTVSYRGVLEAPAAVTVRAPAGSSDDELTVTRGLPAVGDMIADRSVVAEVDGRPIIALASTTAWYRDLCFGAHGPDVAALQTLLGVAASGTVDDATQQAVTALYVGLGYDAPLADSGGGEGASEAATSDSERAAQLGDLTDAVEDAQAEATGARESAASAVADAKRSVAQAQQDLAAADQVVADARAGSDVPLAEAESAQRAARLALETATASAETANREGQRTVQAADRAVTRAQRAVDRERTQQADSARRSGACFRRNEVTGVAPGSVVIAAVATEGDRVKPGAELLLLGDALVDAVAYLPLSEKAALAIGQPAVVSDAALDAPLDATVSSIEIGSPDAGSGDPAAVAPAGPSAETPLEVRVAFAKPPPLASAGVEVLVTVTTSASDGEVVAVPLAAVRRIGSDDVVVTAEDRKRWKVDVGRPIEGWVELRHGAPPVGSLVETG